MRFALPPLARLPLVCLALLLIPGCAVSYRVPGKAADFRALGITEQEAADRTDPAVAERLSRLPAAGFPAVIAAIRIQGEGYRSYSGWGHGEGLATVVTLRDVEKAEDYERLAKLPMIRAVVPMNRMAAPLRIRSERDLRAAAAGIQADMTLLYTFDTKFTDEQVIPALGLLTLGVFPTRQARVTSTASAALVDTRSGYVYALAEATDTQEQLANYWTSEAAVDQSRRRAERRAFEGLLGELERTWKGVAEGYAGAPARQPAARVEVVRAIPARIERTADGWERIPQGVPYRTRE
ncbi:MAG: hypothetical protein WD749_05860 [Phycisphaerales bacterium]